MSTKRFALTVLAAAAVSSAFAQTTTTTATTRQITFPPIGLGSTETAEISVTNVAVNSTAGTAASCTGTISFLSGTGATIGTATSFTVTTEQTFSARLPFGNSGGAAGSRPDIRGLVQVTQSTATPRPPCSLLVTFETYDTTTGATHAVLDASGGSGPGFRN